MESTQSSEDHPTVPVVRIADLVSNLLCCTCCSKMNPQKWGKMVVDVGGTFHNFKDTRVWPGGAEGWDWKVNGTQHKPGILPADVQDILNAHPSLQAIVLSKGKLAQL